MLQEEGNTLPDISEQLNTRHDLLAIAALRRLARKPLAFLHRRAGTVLERETTRNSASTSLLWACAFHWRHAGNRERAFRAARSCAEHLLEVGLPFDAAQALERVLEYCVTDDQRLLVLPRLALSLQMQGLWERSVEVLRRARQIKTQTDPNANVHDEIELALFDASWRGSLEHSNLLSDVRMCVGSSDAPLIHRVACGLLGLKVASAMSEISVMKELYQTLLPLLSDSRVSPATRLEIDMIYQCTCGDADSAEEATKQFLEAARADRTLLTFASALGNAGVAKRLSGRKEEAEKLFIESLDYSIAHGLTGQATFAAHSLVRVYLAANEIVKARAMMQRADLITFPNGDVHLIADQLYLAARISLEEGDIHEASAKYKLIPRANQTLNRRTAVLALGIRIGILEGLSSNKLWALVEELEATHLLLRSGGWQDFEAHALYLGLSACGKLDRAQQRLVEYATTYRREKWPLPKNLQQLMSSRTNSLQNHPQIENRADPLNA
jgi:tetratricopeptide (TPR) repeat protein